MLGEEAGVDGVVVKQLVPRGSADRAGKVRPPLLTLVKLYLSCTLVCFEHVHSFVTHAVIPPRQRPPME